MPIALSDDPGSSLDWKPNEHPITFLGQRIMAGGWRSHRIAAFASLQKRLPLFHYRLTFGEVFLWAPLFILVVVVSALAGCDASGSLATFPFALAFMLASRNSIFTFLLGIPFERALAYHKACAYLAVISGLLHGLIGCANEDDEGDGSDDGDEGNTISGLAICAAMAALIVTSAGPVRRQAYEIFKFLHWPLFIMAAGFGLVHGAGGVMLGLVLFLIDMVIRKAYMARSYAHKATITCLPADVVRVVWERKPGNFNYRGGQYIFLCIPELSIFEWHPFSLSSSPQDPLICVHARVLGDWTSRLQQLAGGSVGSPPKEVRIFLEGPYGEPAVDLNGDRYKSVVLISGGIGITPMQSIANSLIDEFQRGRSIGRIWFIWSVADRYMLEAMHDTGASEESFPSLPIAAKHAPKSFQPFMLKHMGSFDRSSSASIDAPDRTVEDVLCTEFYLTRVREDEGEQALAGINVDLFPHLLYGRPNLPQIMTDIKADLSARGEQRVAVCVCGPQGMISDTRGLCGSMTDDKVSFDFHGETFNF
ncbi:unnamed protein product [Chrysoparadoxa australica]